MLDAAKSLCPGFTLATLKNYKLLKGIVFDADAASEYLIDAVVKPNEHAVTVSMKILSQNAKGFPVYHYSADVVLEKVSRDAPSYSFQLDSEIDRAANDFYHNGTLFHGDSLQGFTALTHVGDKGLRLNCQINASANEKAGDFPMQVSNVFADDLVYQALLIWVREKMGMGSLPSSTLSWHKYREVLTDECFELELIVSEKKANSISADVYLVGSDGLLIAEAKSVQVTASDNLKNLFNKKAA